MDRVTGVHDVMTPLQQWAEMAHEAFTALCHAGFTEDQALTYLSGLHGTPSGQD